jgi:exo-1,4-beta-D-glucosaminidase
MGYHSDQTDSMKKYLLFVASCLCLAVAAQPTPPIAMAPPPTPHQWLLKNNWKMQSAMTDTSAGPRISIAGYDTKDWYSVSVPTTIVAGLIANKVYPFDPFMGQNLQKLTDPKMDKPWWFRREFDLPREFGLPKIAAGRHIILKLHGINYTASVWLNGIEIADSSLIKGPFRIIELDITKQIRYDRQNVLALQIVRPLKPNRDGGDLAIDYADWIPDPPDFNGGIVNDVEILAYGKVGVEYPLVTTHFDLPALTVAHLSVDARVTNYEDAEEDAIVKGEINGNIHFEKKIHLKPLESGDINWDPADFPQLNIKDPRIWWPWQYGKPELNHIEVSVVVDGQSGVADGKPGEVAGDVNRQLGSSQNANFGIREITSQLLNDQSREFIVNGRPIMLRGAAWAPDIFQRRSEERQEQEIRLVRDMNMNIIRSEGKLEDDHFYELCDKYGILVMTGWMCCGAWQHPEHWDSAERAVALASDSSIMYWLRNKACLMVWLNGSDMPPTDASLERSYLDIEKSLKWPNPVIATADGRKSKVSGFSGVKMLGPYEWVPPIYWETDATRNFGGAWSFATEISPGPSIPPYESLVKFIPADSLAPSSATWHYHSGTGNFGTTDIFNKALTARYGASPSIQNYAAKAQAQNYEAHRAMMEAYGLHKYNTATGVVQWMLSNPWPGLIWHTYDYYLYPSGTYFGMKKAMEPLHIMYSYASNSVAIINSLLRKFPELQLQVSFYNLDGARKYNQTLTTSVDEDAANLCLPLPASIDGLSDTWFLRLELMDVSGKEDANGKVQSINWYWLSKKVDTLNWKKSNWYTTPETSYADYSALQDLPRTTVDVHHSRLTSGDSAIHELKITNTGKAVAFFVHLRVLNGKGGDDILPVIFGDNYLLLAPGETRTVRCTYRASDAGGAAPYFLLSGWNLDPTNSRGEPDTGFGEGLPR